MKTEREIREILDFTCDNLELWYSGRLDPTEPDPQERAVAVERLRVVAAALEWALSDEETPVATFYARNAPPAWFPRFSGGP